MNFQLLRQIVQTIITTIEQSAVASVKAIKQHTFSVRVESFPKVQRVEGSVSVQSKNTDGILQRLLIAVGKLPTQYPKTVIPPYPKFPSRIEVSNPVKNVTITQAKTLEEKLDLLIKRVSQLPTKYPEFPTIPKTEIPPYPKFPEIPAFPNSIRVSNPVETVSISNFPKATPLTSTDPKTYVPVRLTDGDEFYRAVESFSVATRRRESVSLTNGDPTVEYQISDKDDATTTKYYGFLKASGAWYILREVNSAYRYATGSDNYSSAWENKSAQEYKLFNEAF